MIEVIDSIPRAAIYKKSLRSQTEPCPFCLASHFHPNEGWQETNCIPMWKKGNEGMLERPKDVIYENGVPLFRKHVVRTDENIKSIFDAR